MAIELRASIGLIDNMTKPMRQISKQMQTFKKHTETISKGVSQMRSSMSGFTSGLGATAAGIIGIVGAQKLLNATIGEAMKLDYNKVSLEAMFNGDAKAAKELSDFIQNKALNSVMTYQEALSSTQSFATLTKNTGEIKEMVNLTERLSYLNPMQGFEGAGFAIKEALGGDMVSLKDRFNLTKDQVQPIKDAANQAEKLKALDAVLSNIGISTEYLGKVNDTTYAKWGKLVDSTKQFLVGLGESALSSVGPFIDKFTTFMEGKEFANFKIKAEETFSSIISKAINFATTIKDNWVPIKETVIALSGALVVLKAGFVAMSIIGTVTKMMNAYKLANVGATTAAALFNGVLFANPIGLVVLALAALTAGIIYVYRNFDTVKAKAIELWNKFGYLKGAVLALLGPFGMIVGAAVKVYQNFDTIKSKAGTMVNSVISGVNKMIGVLNKIPGVNIPIVPKVNWGNITSAPEYSKSMGQGRQTSAAGGLSYVPRDGTLINAHRGERVLTKQENKEYSSGKGGGGNTFQFNVTMKGSGSSKKDADQLFEYFVQKVTQAGLSGA
ncbi:hypothetical protein [Peribacillus frigoritolerans]|uniref:hypothetical protein n=1 Tax=Peribacillus frigoritolerans TaxID=450367 RepID=UPI002E2154C1|nr:hypothetical protein [Peribacillus frigoritolerans]